MISIREKKRDFFFLEPDAVWSRVTLITDIRISTGSLSVIRDNVPWSIRNFAFALTTSLINPWHKSLVGDIRNFRVDRESVFKIKRTQND